METLSFKPGAELSFNSVMDVRAKLYKILMKNKNNHFSLDLSEVVHCDSAGIALLIDARRLCKKNNKTFEIKDMPLKTRSLADFCGLKDIL
jgi:phospholipid transport system transporter-binding protein